MPRDRAGSVITRKDRSGLWAQVTYTDEAGRQRIIQRKVANRTEGKQLLKKLLREIEDHGERIIDGDRMTFRHLAEIYVERKLQPPAYKGETRISGLRSYRSQRFFLKALIEHFGHRRVKGITHSDIAEFKAARLQTQTRRGADRSLANVNRELSLLRTMLNFARREGWIVRNPFEQGESLISHADETKRDRILTRDEEERLLAACMGVRAHLCPLLICALDTGMRRGEMLTLKWSDLDIEGGLIRVRKTTTKTWEGRTIGMTERLKGELRRLWEIAPPDPEGLVFGIKREVKRAFATACRIAGIEDFRLHDCRHTATTRMIQAGMPPMEVMKISGHKQMQTFLRYLNADAQTARRGAAALDGLNAEEWAREITGLVN